MAAGSSPAVRGLWGADSTPAWDGAKVELRGGVHRAGFIVKRLCKNGNSQKKKLNNYSESLRVS